MTPTLSIIVPVYNVESYLDNCIQSILAQDYQDWELILVDDGSKDNCGAMCDNYAAKDLRIRVIHQENKGLSGARNTGIDNARGKYVTFIDSDDEISPDTYEGNIAIMEHNPEIEILQYPTIFEFSTDHSFKREPEPELIQGADNIFIKWHNAYPFNKSSWNKIYRRDVFRNDRFPVGHLHEDFLFFLKVIPRLSTIYISNIGCYFYYSRTTSILHNANLQKDRDWVDAELTMVEQMQAYPQLRHELLPRYMDATRYLMNTTIPFPHADLTPQLRHLAQARPHRISLRRATAKDLLWYHLIALLGPKAFYRIYCRLLRH